jgi:hypothetical protein
VRVTAPAGAYSLLLPHGWRFRNVSFPSDHASELWWTPQDPLDRLVVTLSGCVGCVSTANGAANPAGAIPDAVATTRLNASEIAFTGPVDSAEPGYGDTGVVLVTCTRGRVDGYIRIDLWLPPREQALAVRITRSLRLGHN